ncbi:MAG: PepSY-associated TM helix domain-containing protein [Pseudomonadota bacterium]
MRLSNVHRYLGLVLCLVMLTISVTGVLLVWKKEYLWLTIPQARQTPDLELTAIATVISQIESHHPTGTVQLVRIMAEDLALYKVFLQDRQYAWHDQDGRLIQQWGSNERFEDWLLDLHHRFLLGNTVGLNIAGFGGLLLVPLVILGFSLWWPRRRTLKLGVVPRQLQRGALIRSHANLGAIAIVPILVVAVTGVILVYPTEARTVFLWNQDTQQTSAPSTSTLEPNATPVTTLLEMLTVAHQHYPDAQIRWVSLPSEKYPQTTIGLQQVDGWNRMGHTSISFLDGTVSANSNDLQKPMAERFLNFSYPLHVGKLDLWYRLLLTLFGLALATLCVLGLTSYLRRNAER